MPQMFDDSCYFFGFLLLLQLAVAINEKRIKQAKSGKELTAMCRQFVVIIATCSCYAVVAVSPPYQNIVYQFRLS